MFFIEKEYEDFNGNMRKEKFYFNLTTTECLEMMYSKTGGIDKYIERIIQADDRAEIIEVLKELLLKSYGIKSDDGREFRKSKEISDSFAATNAFNLIYTDLAFNEQKAADFVNRLLPKDLVEKVETYIDEHPDDERVVAYNQLSDTNE